MNYSTSYATTYPPLEAPLSFSAITMTYSTIKLDWIKPSYVDFTYIRYDNFSYPTTITEGTFCINSTGNTFTQSGLMPNTTYYFSAWSYNSSYNKFSFNYSVSYNTTYPSIYVFIDEYPSDGAINVTIYPFLVITVNNTQGNSFNLTWYLKIGRAHV